jgi:hypothetical protein
MNIALSSVKGINTVIDQNGTRHKVGDYEDLFDE